VRGLCAAVLALCCAAASVVAASASVYPVCGFTFETNSLYLSCANGTFIDVVFASFGTPGGFCTNYTANSACDAASTVAVVQKLCVGQSACTIDVSDDAFGDPCPVRTTNRTHCTELASSGSASPRANLFADSLPSAPDRTSPNGLTCS
jgi:hypothetical protein